MTIEWNDPRPLKSGPGLALAMELVDQPKGAAYGLVVAALDALAHSATPAPGDQPEHVEHMLIVYLRGVAAAAIVADAAAGERRWTTARDYALRGEEVEFLPPNVVLLGTLTLALTAIGRAWEVIPAWEGVLHWEHPLSVPFGHAPTVDLIQRALAETTQARMAQVTERAEEVGGV